MKMRIGLCGAQRVGKTTLAREFAKESGLKFVPTNTRQVMKSLGADPSAYYPPSVRLTIQEAILKELCRQWEDSDNCIFDRTPLDVLAYMEADILRDFPEDPILHRDYLQYRTNCLDSVKLFDSLVLIQPGIPIINEDGAALGSLPYMEHFNTLCLGYMNHLNQEAYVKTWIMSRSALSIESRVNFLSMFAKSKPEPHH